MVLTKAFFTILIHTKERMSNETQQQTVYLLLIPKAVLLLG